MTQKSKYGDKAHQTNKFGGRVIKRFLTLKQKMYIYLTEDGRADKSKNTKKCIIKHKIKFKDFWMCLERNKAVLKTHHRFRNEVQIVFKDRTNKNILSSNDDNRLKTLRKINYWNLTSIWYRCWKSG